MLHSDFLAIRAQPDEMVPWNFDNVTLILNIVDSLAGNETLVDIRKRQTRHSTLKRVEQATEDARLAVSNERDKFDDEFEKTRKEAEERSQAAQKELQTKIEELRRTAIQSGQGNSAELMSAIQRLAIQEANGQRKAQIEIEAARKKRDAAVEKIENGLEAEINKVQMRYKLAAAGAPIIPPLIVGGIVWLLRQRRERQGITKARRR
jgi:ABC-2 type transport system permease protein